jgi:hypothetical protein
MALMGLSYLVFDPMVKYIVLKRLVLRNESDFAELWKNPPITPHFKVYFYNFSNPQEFFDGKAVPNLKEIGPFTYHQKWIKENVQWHNNGTMSYSTRKEFEFKPELSISNQTSANLTLVNVPYVSALYQMRKSNYFTKTAAQWFFDSMGMKPWVEKTPEQFVWGYKEDLLELAKNYLPEAPPLDTFGFFTKKNQSQNLPSYTMYTGEGNPYNLSKISLFNGKASLGIWPGETCNKVQGSDGATFNPYIQEDETLWFFNDQLCRSMPLVFQKEVLSRDLPGYRFVPRQDVFSQDVAKYPDNACFCQDEELCSSIGEGMFAVPKCQFQAPIVLSWPHFLNANDTFRQALNGVTPGVPEKHGFWFDIQPTTGTTLSAKARIQINIVIKQDDSFGYLDKVKKDTIIPLLWFEEGLDELGPDLLDVIGEAVNDPPTYRQYILFMIIGMGMTLSCVVLITLVRFCLNKRARSSRSSSSASEKFAKPSSKASKSITSQFKKGHKANNPSQGSGKFLLESEDTSRHHSRNSSTGSTPPTFVHNSVPDEAAKLLESKLEQSTPKI